MGPDNTQAAGSRLVVAAIVGSGASLTGVRLDFPPTVTVIAVNGGIDLTARTDIWFTLDPSRANEAIMRTPRPGVEYVAAVPDEHAPRHAHVRYLRRVTGRGHGRFRTRAGLSPAKDAVHTGNSAWGALQIAVHRGARAVALFGIDGHGAYARGGRPGELSMTPALFASAVPELRARDIAVVNGSADSTVTCFERMTPQEAREWVCAQTLSAG